MVFLSVSRIMRTSIPSFRIILAIIYTPNPKNVKNFREYISNFIVLHYIHDNMRKSVSFSVITRRFRVKHNVSTDNRVILLRFPSLCSVFIRFKSVHIVFLIFIEIFDKGNTAQFSGCAGGEFSAISILQKSRFTASKPSISAIESDRKIHSPSHRFICAVLP